MKVLPGSGGRGVFAAVILFCAGCGVSPDGLATGDPVNPDPARGEQPAGSTGTAGGSPAPATDPTPSPGGSQSNPPPAGAGGSGPAAGSDSPDAAAAAPDATSGTAPPPPNMNMDMGMGVDAAAPAPGMPTRSDAGLPTPDAAPSAPPPSSEAVVIRAMEIEADVVRARVIYAKEVVADSGNIGSRNENPDENRWQTSGSGEKMLRAELVADTVYVKDLRCRRIEAQVVYAKRIAVGQN